MKLFSLVGLGAAVAISASATAQSINIDANIATGAGSGVPSNTFGAAAGAAGVGTWNGLTSLSANIPSAALLGLNGAATGATVTSNINIGPGFGSTTNGLGVINDAQLLLADIWDPGAATLTLTFNGLQNGPYDVYTYAMAPDGAAFRSNVNVNGPAGAANPGNQVVGGAYTGAFVLGVTHSLHSGVQVTNGTLSISVNTNTTFASLAGLQLVLVPGPGALALFGLAGLVGSRRRRA